MFLEKIHTPIDVKKLPIRDLKILAEEIRQALINKASRVGGHLGPNLGMVETTIAMHIVFDSPIDKFVFDVSHQSYVHKMLTGRAENFLDETKYSGVTGYSNPEESHHDHFVIGHTSTSLSLAAGLAKARDLCGRKENIVAVIGDGSLSGGQSFEALDVLGEMQTGIVVVINDNQMSMAENHGGIYQSLAELRRSNGQCQNNIFHSMGFGYIYVDDGNDIEAICKAFFAVKNDRVPVVVHINTVKGKGYAPAEERKENFHYAVPFDIATGKSTFDFTNMPESYTAFRNKLLVEKMKSDPTLLVLTAGTPGAIGFGPKLRAEVGKQLLDVGIAEQCAVSMASAVAKGGAHAVLVVVSTFIQRAYDQLSQDLCINKNPATIVVQFASLTSMLDVTHLCCFDIPLMKNIPNLVYLAPTNKREYATMLNWSIAQENHPVAIREPMGWSKEIDFPIDESYDDLNKYQVIQEGKKVAVIAAGSFLGLGKEVADEIGGTLVNPRFLTGVDEELLKKLGKTHSIIVTLEDGILDGGFGEMISRFYGPTKCKVLNFGGRKEFTKETSEQRYRETNHLTKELIVADILAVK